MSAWASGNLAQKLKQQKLAVTTDGKQAPSPSPTAATTSSSVNTTTPNNNNNNNNIANNNNNDNNITLGAPAHTAGGTNHTAKSVPVVSPSGDVNRNGPPTPSPPAVDPPNIVGALPQPTSKPSPPNSSRVCIGPLSFPVELVNLAMTEFTFAGQVTAPVVNEAVDPPTAHSAVKMPNAPVVAAPRPDSIEPVQTTAELKRIQPMHHHHHHHRHIQQHIQQQRQQQQQQPTTQIQHFPPQQQLQQQQLQQQQQQLQQQQQQQQQQQHFQHHHHHHHHNNHHSNQHRYVQRGMGGQQFPDAYGAMDYNMSPYAAPYQPRMYHRYPGIAMGMCQSMPDYGMQGYNGFSLQERPPYYPPGQGPMGGPFTPPNQQQ